MMIGNRTCPTPPARAVATAAPANRPVAIASPKPAAEALALPAENKSGPEAMFHWLEAHAKGVMVAVLASAVLGLGSAFGVLPAFCSAPAMGMLVAVYLAMMFSMMDKL